MRYLLSIFLTLGFVTSWTQSDNVAINNDGSPPDPSAILDVKSNSKGVTFPRMTTAQRDAISNPTQGLMIYNTDKDCIEYFAELFWIELCGVVAADNVYPAGIYVSLKGNDMTGDGTPWNPYRTVVKGVEELKIQDIDTLRIADGGYIESDVVIHRDTGRVIIGGYDEFTWVRPGGEGTRLNFMIDANLLIDSSENIKLLGLRINGNRTNQSNPTSYGLRVAESTLIAVDSCRIFAFDGLDRMASANGSDGLPGEDGLAGDEGRLMPQPLGGAGGGFATPGGNGGNGSDEGNGFNGRPGSMGDGGIPGGAGGAGGAGEGNNGSPGTSGLQGNQGLDGAGGAGFGVASNSYLASNNGNIGTAGGSGSGGGGGGGGAGAPGVLNFEYGGAGGGGGAGGEGGFPGLGGKAGGGSFGVYVYNSNVVITNSILTSANGGDGGNGGIGGTGGVNGEGGNGGPGANGSGTGGRGGDGGAGGSGGDGGGGGGGPTYAAYSAGSSTINLTNTTLNIGVAGIGGLGPSGGPTNGDNGMAADKNF